jgi:hypothetical protein
MSNVDKPTDNSEAKIVIIDLAEYYAEQAEIEAEIEAERIARNAKSGAVYEGEEKGGIWWRQNLTRKQVRQLRMIRAESEEKIAQQLEQET